MDRRSRAGGSPGNERTINRTLPDSRLRGNDGKQAGHEVLHQAPSRASQLGVEQIIFLRAFPQLAEDEFHWHAGTADDRLALHNGRVDFDSIGGRHKFVLSEPKPVGLTLLFYLGTARSIAIGRGKKPDEDASNAAPDQELRCTCPLEFPPAGTTSAKKRLPATGL